MKTRSELGTIAGELVVKLYRENNKIVDSTVQLNQIPAKKWGHLYRYITGNTVGGPYPMCKAIETMLRYAKTKQTQEDTKLFAKDIAAAGLSEVNFYRCGGGLVGTPLEWVGKEFEVAFIDSLAVNMVPGQRALSRERCP